MMSKSRVLQEHRESCFLLPFCVYLAVVAETKTGNGERVRETHNMQQRSPGQWPNPYDAVTLKDDAKELNWISL